MSTSPPVASQFDSAAQQKHAATLGVWIFLATELLFFGPLFFGYLYGRTHFPLAFAAASRHTDFVLGTANTAVLLTSSASMVIAAEARKLGSNHTAARLLFLTALLGIAFIVIKGTEYRHEWSEHLFPGAGFSFDQAGLTSGAEYFFFLYFVMTGLHALHLLIGITLATIFAVLLQRRALSAVTEERVELVGLYWHFVDIIWIFLYPLLYLIGRSG
jgi:cytochrome c oxidase subunit 3